ncbi:hypothetical protein [Shewanella sp.]|uniref:hypothetical protein n=1 Tax=Shewanella sp. TaxID=50422 RepID=UPI001EB3BC0D|nr:hypothetical protein [Shewanella sp.]NRB25723.1 hypothetical protein [Shewanella sp.]
MEMQRILLRILLIGLVFLPIATFSKSIENEGGIVLPKTMILSGLDFEQLSTLREKYYRTLQIEEANLSSLKAELVKYPSKGELSEKIKLAYENQYSTDEKIKEVKKSIDLIENSDSNKSKNNLMEKYFGDSNKISHDISESLFPINGGRFLDVKLVGLETELYQYQTEYNDNEYALSKVTHIQELVRIKEGKVSLIQEHLYQIESEITNVLDLEKRRMMFRVSVTFAFCVLVAIVIIGFFYISYKNNEIAVKVFSGENGIKFITLFLVIIAIILFGIMGILESKELSALLGGIAGFILGKESSKA